MEPLSRTPLFYKMYENSSTKGQENLKGNANQNAQFNRIFFLFFFSGDHLICISLQIFVVLYPCIFAYILSTSLYKQHDPLNNKLLFVS